MSTVYTIIERSCNYGSFGSLSSLIAEKLETAGINGAFAVRAAVHLASIYEIAFPFLRQIELFKLSDNMSTTAKRTLTVWELAQSIKFHADILSQQAQEITNLFLQSEDMGEVVDHERPLFENEAKGNPWFKDRYNVVERVISKYAPRLLAVRWTHNLLGLVDDLFNLINGVDALVAEATRFPEDIKSLWLDISFNWTTAGEGALIHLGNYTATGLDRIDPGVIGWSLVLIEEMRYEGLEVI